MLEFKECFVAFIDILGFKNIVKDQLTITRIDGIIGQWLGTHANIKSENAIVPAGQLKVTSFSDSIILSIPTHPNGYFSYKMLRYLLSIIERIQFSLAKEGVWFRGGISWGQLHHDKNIYGDGLVRAYQIEQTAEFPRVVLDPELLVNFFMEKCVAVDKDDFVKNLNVTYGEPTYSGKFIFEKARMNGGYGSHFKDDVPFFIDYMNSFFEKDKVNDDERDQIIDNIRKNLYSSKDKSIYSKYRWVVEYLISTAPIYGENKHLEYLINRI